MLGTGFCWHPPKGTERCHADFLGSVRAAGAAVMCETSGPQSTNSCDHFSYFKPLGSESSYPTKPGTGPDGVSQNQVRGLSVGAKRGASYIRGGALYPEPWTRLCQRFRNIVSFNISSYLHYAARLPMRFPEAGRATLTHGSLPRFLLCRCQELCTPRLVLHPLCALFLHLQGS